MGAYRDFVTERVRAGAQRCPDLTVEQFSRACLLYMLEHPTEFKAAAAESAREVLFGCMRDHLESMSKARPARMDSDYALLQKILPWLQREIDAEMGIARYCILHGDRCAS